MSIGLPLERSRLTATALSERGFARVATWLSVAYVVALLALPNDVGFHTQLLVLTPSRFILGVLLLWALATGRLVEAVRTLPLRLVVAWAVFVAAASVSSVLNLTPQIASRLGSLILEGTLLFLVVQYIARDERAAGRLVLAAFVTTAAVMAIALVLAAAGYRYEEVVRSAFGMAVLHSTDERFGVSRQEASFPAPLFLSVWLIASAALVLPWLEEQRHRALLAWIAWIILVAGVLSTVSRTAIVAALIVASAYFCIRARWAFAAAMLVLALLSGTVMAQATSAVLSTPSTAPSPTVTAAAAGTSSSPSGSGGAAVVTPAPTPGLSAAERRRAEEQAMALEGSLQSRVDALKAGWVALVHRPFFGYGLISGGDAIESVTGKVNYVDNTYLSTVLELGIVGFAAFLLLIVATFVPLLRRPWSRQRLAVMLAAGSILAMSALASFLEITQGYASLWLLAGIATGMFASRELSATSDAVAIPVPRTHAR